MVLEMAKRKSRVKATKNWTITNWRMAGNSTWSLQPVILIEGETPFFADHPQAYIDKLRLMRDAVDLMPGGFWTLLGQFRDAMEQGYWDGKVRFNQQPE